MLTYTGRRDLYGDLTNDDSSANLTLGDTLLNDAEKEIIGMRAWPFLERAYTQNTVADQQYYEVPNDIEYVISVSVIDDTIRYTPDRAPSLDFWNNLNSSTSITSDQPSWWYLRDGQIGLYPAPSSAITNGLEIVGRRMAKDLNQADFTTGNVTDIANGATAVTGSGTSWTAGMEGSFIRITASQSADKGDGRWYEIESIDSGTTLTLVKPYQGTTLSGASAAYTIGQAGLLPQDYQILPVFRACEYYFTTIQPDGNRAEMFRNKFETRLQSMIRSHGRKSDDPTIRDVGNVPFINPNLTIQY